MAVVPDYGGAEECDPLEFECNVRGFKCPDESAISCYGKKGLDIVESISISYAAFERDDHFGRNLGIILAFGVVRAADARVLPCCTVHASAARIASPSCCTASASPLIGASPCPWRRPGASST